MSGILCAHLVSCVSDLYTSRRYYKEFMIEPRITSVKYRTDRPLVKCKVIPASFGLEGFEDAIWAATEDLLGVVTPNEEAKRTIDNNDEDDYCKAITFVVAAPDLADPILLEDSMPRLSPQAEFEQTTFKVFSSTLREKLTIYSSEEGLPLLNDMIDLKPYHPLWKDDGRFPYPCVAVSTKVG